MNQTTIEQIVIADNIRKVRVLHHLTQAQMAEILGYSIRQIRRLETEGTDSVSVLNWIASSFEIPTYDLLKEGNPIRA